MKKKIISLVLTVVMITTLLPAIGTQINVQASTTISIGDYVQMGRYYDEPILWRCVDIDENGPLMLADRILTIKAFDATGNHTYADGSTQGYGFGRILDGSNLWETSNMRCWLNSTATAGNITWLDGCPPIADKVWSGYNAYANEKGFLAEGNFTTSEQNVIKSVTQKSLLNGIDVPKLSIGGTATHIRDFNISTLVQNYDTAYYHNVTDKMFLLDVKQENKVYQNSATLGANYYKGKPTQKSIDNSDYNNMSTTNYWQSWIRTPYADSNGPCYVRLACNNGSDYAIADDSILGVRPAFYINLSSVIFKSGDGMEGSPYVATGGNEATPTPMGKTALEDAIALANTKLLISYGTISWNAMDGARTVAVEVDNNVNALESDINVATNSLTSAINALILLGDVNFSGGTNSADALFALQASTGRRILTDNQKVAADVNKNGSVTSTDALRILQYASGRITQF